jgi:NDP-sugar pyrophosphorylase family protein
VIESGKNGIMTDAKEKPEFTYMINTGVYILNPELIDEIPEGKFFHITDLMDKVRSRGGQVGCFPVSEKSWTDVGEWNEYVKIVNREQK